MKRTVKHKYHETDTLVMKTMIPLVAIIAMMVAGCEIQPNEKYGFNSPFSAGSSGNTFFIVNDTPCSVTLKGSVDVEEGSITAELISPSGITLFRETVAAHTTVHIDRSFTAGKGLWRLQYRSDGGEGFISLHAEIAY